MNESLKSFSAVSPVAIVAPTLNLLHETFLVRIADHPLANLLDLMNLLVQFSELVPLTILIQVTAVDVVTAGAVRTSPTKDEELLSLLVEGYGRCPAGLRSPASL